jgi:hypothetical protein
MKRLITASLFFYCVACPAKEPPLDEVRILYQQAATDENSCKALIEMLKPYNDADNPLLLGYKGGATMMMAQHVPNPFTKLSYFKKGKDLLHYAIEEDQMNIELRYLRFAAQTNAPVLLAYRNKIEEDKTFLVKSVSLLGDQSLKKLILGFLRNSDLLTEREKQELVIRS